MLDFKEEEISQIEANGLTLAQVKSQLSDFKTGFEYLNVVRPATVGDGIIKLPEAVVNSYVDKYDQSIKNKDVLKFVPASGAATRMFKDLFTFMESEDETPQQAVKEFVESRGKFAFCEELKTFMDSKSADGRFFIKALLSEDGLGYGQLPKGLLSFHTYPSGVRTAFEEHMVEGAQYGKSSEGVVNLHFTVSPEHEEKFQSLIAKVKSDYEEKFGVTYAISFSQQNQSTDTIAVDEKNHPFKENNGTFLFRPAGHGALLNNLNELAADVIFVKNIDNVVPDHLREDTIRYKKTLAGLLIDFQQQVFKWLGQIEKGEVETQDILNVLKDRFQIDLQLDSLQEIKVWLDRPIRVCGMVQNTGEPGGGPFWIGDEKGQSLQIAETAQINMDDSGQRAILKDATHFNPVDLVCAPKNHKGEKFDLLKFRDNKTGFITNKTRNGKAIKAMELPGLWNGAMADWITLFVEVPITTFSPVKTVNDLLKPSHQ